MLFPFLNDFVLPGTLVFTTAMREEDSKRQSSHVQPRYNTVAFRYVGYTSIHHW